MWVGGTSPTFLETHSDQLLDKCLRQRLVDREVEGALCHRVPLKLVGKVRQDRTAERQVTQVIPKCGKACDGLTADAERRYTIGDELFRLGHDLEDRAAERLKRSALWLLEVLAGTRQRRRLPLWRILGRLRVTFPNTGPSQLPLCVTELLEVLRPLDL